MVVNVLILTGFIYFLVEVSISYFQRQVVSETLIEPESQIDFPSVSICWSPIITQKRFQFVLNRNPSTDSISHDQSCQHILLVWSHIPLNKRVGYNYSCPYALYNQSLKHHFAEPFRDFEESIRQVYLTYATEKEGVLSQKLYLGNYSTDIVHRDSLRCYVIHFNLSGIPGTQTKAIEIKISREQGTQIRRVAITPPHHLPRGYFPFVLISHITG